MSYCVNCGVELEKSEKCCPLCGVEVHNPLDPYDPQAPRPYPQRVERLIRRKDRRYFLLLASLFLQMCIRDSR